MTVLKIPAETQIITEEVVNTALALQELDRQAITEIIIPENVTEIGRDAFMHFYSLTTVILPNGITKIGMDAFFWCNSLALIEIPESAAEINVGAFEWTLNLKTIYVSDMLAVKGKEYWIQRGVLTNCLTLMRHSEIKAWVVQHGLCITNVCKQAALNEVCQRQFNQEQIPDIFLKIPYADLIKLTGYHNNALLLKIPRTLNRLDDINYTELCLFKRRNSISTIPLKLLEFLTSGEANNLLKAHLPCAKMKSR